MLKQMEHIKHCPFKVLKKKKRGHVDRQTFALYGARRAVTYHQQRFIVQGDLSNGNANKCIKQLLLFRIHIIFIISNLSNDRYKASSKTIPPHSAIQSFLLQLTVSSPVLKVIQQLLTPSSSSSYHFHLPLYLSFNNLLQKAVST